MISRTTKKIQCNAMSEALDKLIQPNMVYILTLSSCIKQLFLLLARAGFA